jgi:dihydrofolate reductase
MEISIVVAMSTNGLIGRDGELPWHLSADLQHFKTITMGKAIVMGRLTHESIGRPLPGRENIILTRDPDYEANGCTVIHDLQQFLAGYSQAEEIMIIGGAQLYAQTLALASKLLITEVHAELAGDTYFPVFARDQWRETERRRFAADEKNEFDYSFVVLQRL